MTELTTTCPICNSDFHNIAMSYWVCEQHLNWIVTKCDKCGKYCYSYFVGGCPECYGCLGIEDIIEDFTGMIEDVPKIK